MSNDTPAVTRKAPKRKVCPLFADQEEPIYADQIARVRLFRVVKNNRGGTDRKIIRESMQKIVIDPNTTTKEQIAEAYAPQGWTDFYIDALSAEDGKVLSGGHNWSADDEVEAGTETEETEETETQEPAPQAQQPMFAGMGAMGPMGGPMFAGPQFAQPAAPPAQPTQDVMIAQLGFMKDLFMSSMRSTKDDALNGLDQATKLANALVESQRQTKPDADLVAILKDHIATIEKRHAEDIARKQRDYDDLRQRVTLDIEALKTTYNADVDRRRAEATEWQTRYYNDTSSLRTSLDAMRSQMDNLLRDQRKEYDGEARELRAKLDRVEGEWRSKYDREMADTRLKYEEQIHKLQGENLELQKAKIEAELGGGDDDEKGGTTIQMPAAGADAGVLEKYGMPAFMAVMDWLKSQPAGAGNARIDERAKQLLFEQWSAQYTAQQQQMAAVAAAQRAAAPTPAPAPAAAPPAAAPPAASAPAPAPVASEPAAPPVAPVHDVPSAPIAAPVAAPPVVAVPAPRPLALTPYDPATARPSDVEDEDEGDEDEDDEDEHAPAEDPPAPVANGVAAAAG